MKNTDAVNAFLALGQESRLNVFRLIVQKGDVGLTPTQIHEMLGIPNAEDRSDWFAAFRPLIKDAQTLEQFSMPAQYMFKDIPDEIGEADNRLDSIAETVAQMDAHNIAVGVIHMSDDRAEEAMRKIEEVRLSKYARRPTKERYQRRWLGAFNAVSDWEERLLG